MIFFNKVKIHFWFIIVLVAVVNPVLLTSQNRSYTTKRLSGDPPVIDELGWVAEMKIPYNQLRFAKEEDHVWGMELIRMLFRKEEMSLWQMIPVDAGGLDYKYPYLESI